MNSSALLMLIERLLWPVPRVRWEAARGLARLIREGNRDAVSGLLNWIGTRRLESEAVLGLGIIDAFDLSPYFEYTDVLRAVRAPSHLSDYLLKRNFTDASGLSPFRYAISSPESVTLPHEQTAWFELYCKSAVPPMFLCMLTQFQQSTGFPFLRRWEHEWRWLQTTDPRPEAEYPHFFCKDRDHMGQFDLGQRELYVSAYLRTLAYFALSGVISHEVAEHFAMLALTMNRGLADLEPVERPDWTRNLLPCDIGRMKELAQKLWGDAEAAAKPGEVPLVLRVVDFDTEGFVEIDSSLTVGSSGFISGPAEAEELDEIIKSERPGDMAGLVGREAGIGPLSIEHPLAIAQVFLPEFIGRVHIGMAMNIRLASPYMFGVSANVQCGATEIQLETRNDVLSRWVHWYADWDPAILPELKSDVSSMTTILRSSLDQLRARQGLDVARLVRIRRVARRGIYRELEVEEEAYWA